MHPHWGQMPPDTIADAASMIVLRGAGAGAQVLMGQRGAGAAFMPRKFVFPGGRVDAGDFHTGLPDLLAPSCRAALTAHVENGPAPHALTAAALRELHEETGLHLARQRPAALRFVFRAITPKGPPRRFDARFFLAQSDDFAGDMQGFSAASGELTLLQWLTLPQARALDLPFITRVILAELASTLAQGAAFPPQGVPFFDNTSGVPRFLRL